MADETKAQETKPVLAEDGTTILGYCEVSKYRRIIGQPLKKIIIRDMAKNCVAMINVYRLHSRVHCGSLVVDGEPVDSKRAIEIARAALQNGSDPQALVEVIQKEAQRLAPLRAKSYKPR
jgi:hypothetical protein